MVRVRTLTRLAGVLTAFLVPSTGIGQPAPSTIDLRPGDDLSRVLAESRQGTTIVLSPGRYPLDPYPLTEPTCGNCEDPNTPVAVTVGALLRGRDIRVVGAAGPDSTVIHTGAGYGLFFDGCHDCVLEGVTVTGGIRDPDGNATDAAVVVKHSVVRIRNCHIRDNIGDVQTVGMVVVGIIGVAGREGGYVEITDSRIVRNSWDGVALYRGATGIIRNTVIDGVDAARGKEIGGGRGVGIGVTWDAQVWAEGNLVRNYWKGIGLFVNADGTLMHNVVEDVLTWGISLWDAGKGRPRGRITGNAVYRTGACGLAVVRSDTTHVDPGYAKGNAFVATGQDPKYDTDEPYCRQTAIAEHAVPPAFTITDNLFYENREPGDVPGPRDLDEAGFREAVQPLVGELAQWQALWGAEFLIRFGN